MMKLSLIVMAAGMASRYGSLKQVESFGPSGETLMEYSIYNAIRAGFDKVVFIVRNKMLANFKDQFGSKISDMVEVGFASQELDNLPEGFTTPTNRTKPWGTGHAVLVAEKNIDGPFAVINADDFYGPESFHLMATELKKLNKNHHGACVVGYQLKNTLSEYGSVSRAVCELSNGQFLEKLTERTKIQRESDGNIYASENRRKILLSGNELVSMNLLGFTHPFFQILNEGFTQFLSSKPDNSSEYYLPDAITKLIIDHQGKVPVVETGEKTFGVTYKDDKEQALQEIQKLVKNGTYPSNLWKQES